MVNNEKTKNSDLKNRSITQHTHSKKTKYIDLKILAKERGGVVLTSKEEFNSLKSTPSFTEFMWQCNQEHNPFRKKLQNVKRGSWCPQCSRIRKYTYMRLINIAKKRGLEKNNIEGKVVTTYNEFLELKKKQPPNKSNYKWSCQIKNHKPWNSRLDSIEAGSWCPYCAKNRRHGLVDLQHLAKNRGIEETGKPGRLLLTQDDYDNLTSPPSKTHFIWQCGENHEAWRSTATNIQQGRWCPRCSEGKWEKIVRYYFENIFKAKFPKKKPKWLYVLTGHRLELDGYNKNLKIAFELNGPQHYIPVYGIDKFIKQREFDDLKRKACKQQGILLIEIPYDFDGIKNTVDQTQLLDYIVKIYENHSGEKLPKIPKFNYSTRNFKRLDIF